MHRLMVFSIAAFTSAAAIAGCSGGGGNLGGGNGGGGNGTPTEPPPIVTTQSYPASMATAAGGGTAWAITQVKTTLYGQFHNASGNAYDTLRVDVTFAQNVANALPSPGQQLTEPSQLGMSIRFDTGSSGYYEGCSQSASFKPFQYITDFGNDPGRLADGNYSIENSSGPIYSGPSDPGSEAQTSVNGNVITQVFFLGTLGVEAGSKVPDLKIAVASENGASYTVATDCVPSGNSEIPTD